MSTISSLITDIRYEINDTESTRWETDTPILAYIKRAVTRANRICQRNGLHFAKKKATIPTVASQAYVSLPADFDIDISLFRDANHTKLTKRTEDEWEQIVTAESLTSWMLDLENNYILLVGTPVGVENLTFWYYPKVDVSAYTTATTMPWSGRLDDTIIEYVASRLKNVDEFDLTADQQFLTDFENQIIQAYDPLNPTIIPGDGWMNNMG